MGIKGDDIFHAHIHKLLESHGAVQGLTPGSLVLAALIEERHDDIQTAGLAVGSSNDSLEILEMVVGRHVIDISGDTVGHAVIADINHKIEVIATDRFLQFALALTGAEARRIRLNNEGILLVAGKCDRGFMFALALFSPLHQPVIDPASELRASHERNQPQRPHRDLLDLLVSHVLFHCFCHIVLRIPVISGQPLPVLRETYQELGLNCPFLCICATSVA